MSVALGMLSINPAGIHEPSFRPNMGMIVNCSHNWRGEATRTKTKNPCC